MELSIQIQDPLTQHFLRQIWPLTCSFELTTGNFFETIRVKDFW